MLFVFSLQKGVSFSAESESGNFHPPPDTPESEVALQNLLSENSSGTPKIEWGAGNCAIVEIKYRAVTSHDDSPVLLTNGFSAVLRVIHILILPVICSSAP